MDCFAKHSTTSKKCTNCTYVEACIFAKEYDAKVKKSNGSYNSRSGGGLFSFIEDYTDKPDEEQAKHLIELTSEEANKNITFSYSEVLVIIGWLLKIMDSDILRSVLKLRLKSNIAIAEIARQQEKSRQLMHWQIKKELNRIFGVDNTKNAKNRIR